MGSHSWVEKLLPQFFFFVRLHTAVGGWGGAGDEMMRPLES